MSVSRKERLALFDWVQTGTRHSLFPVPRMSKGGEQTGARQTSTKSRSFDGLFPVPRVPRNNVETGKRSAEKEKASRPINTAPITSRLVDENAGNTGNTGNELETPKVRPLLPALKTPVRDIDPAVAVEIRRIETQALELGWSREHLWGAKFWPIAERGLAALMDPGDPIVEVTAETITILKYRRDLQKFYRRSG